MRLVAIGDLHGCSTAFDVLLEKLCLGKEDVLVTLGDYVDRGPDSEGVIDRLLALRERTTLVPLLGNHDALFLEVLDGVSENFRGWLSVGGIQTLESYGGKSEVPDSHVEFLRSGCRLWYEPEGEQVFFVHGSVFPGLALSEQTREWLLWRRIFDAESPHISGKTMICGHTAQRSGLPLIMPHAICIDTWAFGDGWLTAYDVHEKLFIQANQTGESRRISLKSLSNS